MSDPSRSPAEVRAIQAHLQALADRPALRQRAGIARASAAAAPFADSRRPTDPTDTTRRYIADNSPCAADQQRNYATGLL